MDCCYIICSCCQINVGFLKCCTCHKDFEFYMQNYLPITCPRCVNIRLDTYYQSDQDVQLHRNCNQNIKRMFHYCKCCDGYFCQCVQQISIKLQVNKNEKINCFKSSSYPTSKDRRVIRKSQSF
ncbi:unnamed protein product [Paramecium primaurelia]|uniref:Uncharacterized protein n=1 Tax=Paramecium primaurelia TaxID=5886 RepID=A0A8S1PDA6_PARPR|nr:unnamed protein product [Paramecium primaurelia]